MYHGGTLSGTAQALQSGRTVTYASFPSRPIEYAARSIAGGGHGSSVPAVGRGGQHWDKGAYIGVIPREVHLGLGLILLLEC